MSGSEIPEGGSNELSRNDRFLQSLDRIIESNLSNDQFGVEQLAESLNISRTQLFRRLQKLTGKNISQYLRGYRLKKALELLKKDVASASEIAYQVGFSSPSYFNKCFHEYYGYTPGSIAKEEETRNKPILPEDVLEDNQPKHIQKTENAVQGNNSYASVDIRVPRETSVLTKNKIIYIFFVIGIIIIGAVILLKFLPIKNITMITTKGDISIAVLPFKSLSQDPEKQYMADGVMDAILSHLSKVKRFLVMSRTSVEKYRDKSIDPQEIGKELGVDFLLEGSFQIYQNEARVIVQLIKTIDGSHIWSNEYDREWTDIFKVQSEIALDIAEELNAEITPKEKQIIEIIPTENIEAYELYLRGREFQSKYWSSSKQFDLNYAIHFYEQAIELDSQFVVVYRWLAWAIYYQGLESDRNHTDTMLYFADKILSIFPDHPEGYFTRGTYYYEIGDYDNSIPLYEKSIELDPNLGDAYNKLGLMYHSKNQFISAIKNYKKAIKLRSGDPDEYPYIIHSISALYVQIWDPKKAELELEEYARYDPISAYFAFIALYSANGEWDKAKTYTDKICDIDSGESCFASLFNYYELTKDYPKALYYLEKWSEKNLSQRDLQVNAQTYGGIVFDNTGKKKEARKRFNKQIERCLNDLHLKWPYKFEGDAYCELVGVYSYLGEKDSAYYYLHEMEKLTSAGWAVKWMQVYHAFESLWDDEEFKAIIERQEKKFANIRAEINRLEKEGVL